MSAIMRYFDIQREFRVTSFGFFGLSGWKLMKLKPADLIAGFLDGRYQVGANLGSTEQINFIMDYPFHYK